MVCYRENNIAVPADERKGERKNDQGLLQTGKRRDTDAS